jgi:hypothetical protein
MRLLFILLLTSIAANFLQAQNVGIRLEKLEAIVLKK